MQSLWMLFASFTFSIMSVCVKLASATYSTSEIVLYRGFVGTLFLAGFITLQGGGFKTRFPMQHLWRGVVGVIALWMWFYAIARLPIATGMTLNYTSPIWIAIFLFGVNWWRGSSRFEWGLAIAVLFSFIGVTLLLRPSVHSNQGMAAAIGIASGMLSALAYLQVRKLGQMGEPEYRVVFYFSLTGLITGVLGNFAESGFTGVPALTPHAHTAKGLFLLLAIGITATVAQIAMTRAYRLGKTLVTANLQYTGIVFSSVWGVLLWGDLLDWMGWAGIAIILASGSAATFYNARNAAAPPKPSVNEANDPIATEL
ncbi:DMT family transporter [Oxalobacteraceae bacterium OM1]|nr:DMT family transporter [Oxalobacteraceae bacterium OM1]